MAFSQSIIDPSDEHKAIDSAFHLLNLFDISKGLVREKTENDKIHYEFTQWTSAADLKNRQYYIHT